MGKAGVPPAVVCESQLMQARRQLYPQFRSLVHNMRNQVNHSAVFRKRRKR